MSKLRVQMILVDGRDETPGQVGDALQTVLETKYFHGTTRCPEPAESGMCPGHGRFTIDAMSVRPADGTDKGRVTKPNRVVKLIREFADLQTKITHQANSTRGVSKSADQRARQLAGTLFTLATGQVATEEELRQMVEE